MPEVFAEMLSGGHPNSLGRTEEVVGLVLADGSAEGQDFILRFPELSRLRPRVEAANRGTLA